MVWFSSLVQPLHKFCNHVIIADESQRFHCLMRALIIKVVVSCKGPYGYSFFCICKNTLPKGKRKIWEACAVDWGIAMLCTRVQRAGFSGFFYSPEDHFYSCTHTAYCSMRQSHVTDTHTLSTFICKTDKKLSNVCDHCVISLSFSRGLWHWIVLFLLLDGCQLFLLITPCKRT